MPVGNAVEAVGASGVPLRSVVVLAPSGRGGSERLSSVEAEPEAEQRPLFLKTWIGKDIKYINRTQN